MSFRWDPEKYQRNIRIHGVAFDDAVRIFDGPTLERLDDRFVHGEARIYAVGLVNGVEITVIYTDKPNDERRIISSWKATRHEREAYWKDQR